MATFLLRGTYAKEAFQTLIDEPVDREKAFKEVLNRCGIELICWFYSSSNSGWISICEGTPEQVAGTVRFLAADPAAAYITRQVFQVDGGMVM